MSSKVKQSVIALLVLGALVFPRFKAHAQHNATLYFMRELPLVNTLNPAFQPEAGSIYIGLPVISSVYFSGLVSSDGLYYNPIASALPSLAEIVASSSAYERGLSMVDINLMNIGVLVRDMYFTFDVTTRAQAETSIPSELNDLVWKGNGQYLGKAVSMDGLGRNLEMYTEFAFGFSKEIVRNKVTVGGKAKYLMGHAYAETYFGKNSFVYTDPVTWDITAGLNPNVNLAGISSNIPMGVFSTDTFKFQANSYSPTVAGNGGAIDLGFEIKGDKFTASGSVINLGAIQWKHSTHIEAAQSKNVQTFRGVQIGGNDNPIETIKDSILKVTTLRGSKQSVTRWIDPTLMFGLSYELHEHFNAGVLAAINISQRNNYPMFALSLNTQKFMINGSLSYSYSNGYNNIGIGFLFGQRDLQFHVICDNILAVGLQGIQQTNVRLGLSLLLGDPKNASPKQTWKQLNPTPDPTPKKRTPASNPYGTPTDKSDPRNQW